MGSDRVRRPSDLSATLCIDVYASFEVQPALSTGEQLRELTTIVEELLDCSAKCVREWDRILCDGLGTHTMSALILSPKDWDVVSSCSSASVIVKRKCNSSTSLTLRVVCCSQVIGESLTRCGRSTTFKLAANVARGVYAQLFRDGTRADYRCLRLRDTEHRS